MIAYTAENVAKINDIVDYVNVSPCTLSTVLMQGLKDEIQLIYYRL